MTRSSQNSMKFSRLLAISFLLVCCSSSLSASVVPEKRQFLLPRFLFKSSNERAREQQIKIVEEPIPVVPETEITIEPVDAATSLDDVPVNVFPIRRPQKEPIARRPCYFSPIQCLLHTPDHDRKFANYPEFQQHARSVNREEPFIAGTVANAMQISSPRVKAAVEALLVQKQIEQKLMMKAQRRMLRQSAMPPPAVGTPALALASDEQPQTQQHLSRHRLFGTPWRRGL